MSNKASNYYQARTCQTTWDPSISLDGERQIYVDAETFNAHNVAVFHVPERTWEKAVGEVLEEHAEAWRRLAKL